MAMKCDNCAKGIMYGHNVSHSKRRTNRTFQPNLQHTKVKVEGKMVRMKLCTNCIKRFRKDERDRMTKLQKATPAAATA